MGGGERAALAVCTSRLYVGALGHLRWRAPRAVARTPGETDRTCVSFPEGDCPDSRIDPGTRRYTERHMFSNQSLEPCVYAGLRSTSGEVRAAYPAVRPHGRAGGTGCAPIPACASPIRAAIRAWGHATYRGLGAARWRRCTSVTMSGGAAPSRVELGHPGVPTPSRVQGAISTSLQVVQSVQTSDEYYH